jgi:hypothetical protein
MFLDREPYIRFWRPTYQVLGPTIRRVKGLIGVTPAAQAVQAAPSSSVEERIAALEASNRQLWAALEQALLSALATSETLTPDEFRKTLDDALAAQTAQLSAANAAQWAAIEKLLVAALGPNNASSLNLEANSFTGSDETRNGNSSAL